MDKPDFGEITSEDVDSSSSSSSSSKRTGFKQMHVKGRFGTETVKNTKGCRVCGRNSELLLLIGYTGEGREAEWDGMVQVCESHEGDVRGDLEVDQSKIEVREF